jgi:large subunit ribosomal protein L22
MQAHAKSKYVRVSPRKARLAADLIRGLNVQEALLQLQHSQTKAGKLLKKTLDSAIANAENNFDLSQENLEVAEVRVDEGPRWKRAKSKSRGGRAPILKRTSHLTVVVGQHLNI